MGETKIEQTVTGSTGVTLIGVQHNYYGVHQTGQPPPPLPIRAPKLFGRDELLSQVQAALDGGGTVLLHGGPGFGKTALAATAAKKYLERGVLWLTVGREAGLEAMLNGVGTAFGREAGQAMAAATTQADKLAVARGLIGQARPLVVLDDVWDGRALATILAQAISPGVSVLVTSRTHFPKMKAFDVLELPRSDARALLAFHAGWPSPPAPLPQGEGRDADALCELLGDHAYAVEIAGAWLQDESVTPAEIMARIKDAPHTLEMPEGFAEIGRESVRALLLASVAALDTTTQAAFWALGTLFAPRCTPELLALLLTPSPESPLPPVGGGPGWGAESPSPLAGEGQGGGPNPLLRWRGRARVGVPPMTPCAPWTAARWPATYPL